ncbi:acyl-CoA dehydrogenase family protein [Halalkalibacter alkalisediminis]|uniref:Acyl-CoA dehydrogenase family protein n=1 Tax=Halalkalibacter alkalisediminis TaxID=935616 RepID=A0ABV6NDB3_9BACI|nr:acyl-CoA dehydrogenase family protein [Halalkalibacter alkalisediminis]
MQLHKATTLEERKVIIRQTVKAFAKRAQKHDEENTFPMENIEDLKKIGYTSLTVPKSFGGQGLPLSEWLPLQEIIAEQDGSTALSIGWHMGLISQLGERLHWPPNIINLLFREIVQEGKLINAAASEPETGSPTRGGKPTTRAHKKGDSWIVSGRKNFTSMAPALDYFIVSATTDDGQVGNFFIQHSAKGVRIEETWNSIAMRGTASHDLHLDQVEVSADHLVELIQPGNKRPAGWLLHIPTCYLGIAQAAQNFAIDFSHSYSPNSLDGSIKELPNVQVKIGENEAALMQARYFLYGVAKKWDSSNEADQLLMQSELGAVKYHVVNAAIDIVDRAMRVVGAQSLFKNNDIQRYYRDVRAGLHNPPMDDLTLILLAKEAFQK